MSTAAPREVATLEAKLRDNPSDPQAWLVYADHLLERGDVRGEIIALQHRLAIGARFPLAERRTIEARIAAIEASHRPIWLAGDRSLKGTSYTWRYGFIVGAQLPWKRTTPRRLAALVAHPSARFLTSLDLSRQHIGDEGIRALLESRALSEIRALNLYSTAIGDEGIASIARDPDLGRLHTLDLQHNLIGDMGAAAISSSKTLVSLRMLHLWDNRIGEEGLAALASSERLRGCAVYAQRQRGW